MSKVDVPHMTVAYIEHKQNRDIKKMVQNDIRKIDGALNDGSETALRDVHIEIDSKYQTSIENWGMSMDGFKDRLGFTTDMLGIDSLVENLKIMKGKMEVFSMGLNTTKSSQPGNINIGLSAYAENHVENNINIEVTFQNVRDEISGLSAIPSNQVDEICEKITELETIVKSGDKQRTKWDKAMPIFQYILDKGIDVAKIVVPLIAQI